MGLTANRYRENDHLDFEGIDLNGRWDWAYGRATSGELAVLQTQTLSSFDDFAGEQRAVNTYRRLSFTADRLLAPEWLAGIGASMASSDYSGETRPTAEYEERGFSLRAGYRPRAGDQLTLSLNRTHGEYPNRTATLAADRAYDQQDLRLDGRWQITSATRLAGYIGYTGRSYDFADNRDFDGMTGRVELDWAVTAKAAISAVVRREIGAQEDLVDNFVVTDSLLLRPRWSPTEKIALSTEFELRKRDYGGDPGLGGVVPSDRSEELRRFGVFANYQLRRTVSLGAGLRWENRSSDDERRDYSADSASLTARVAF